MNEQAIINDINATLRGLEALMPIAQMEGKLDAVCHMYAGVYLLKLRAMK
jgi:hypothetical protein